MHVLFVLNTWGLVGGTERHAAVVIPELIQRGFRVTVLCSQTSGDLPAQAPVIEFQPLVNFRSHASQVAEVMARVAEIEPDVVFVSALLNVDVLEALVGRYPLVRYVHDHVVFCPSHNKYLDRGDLCTDPMGLVCLRRYWLEGGCVCFKKSRHAHPIRQSIKELRDKRREVRLTRAATRVLTNSNYMRAELLQVGFDPERTSVLHYFTRSNTADQPLGPLSEATEAFASIGNAPLLFTSARLTLPDKGVDFLLTTMTQLTQDFRLVIAGSGIAEDWLRQKAVDEGLADRVHFCGWLDKGAVETLYSRADVVVCPSVWNEPFGLVGIEAMAHAKPVVAFDVGGISDWLSHEETGFLVPRKDTRAMAAAIDRLLGDPALRARMGRSGKALVAERFERQRHVAGLERCLREAAGARGQEVG